MRCCSCSKQCFIGWAAGLLERWILCGSHDVFVDGTVVTSDVVRLAGKTLLGYSKLMDPRPPQQFLALPPTDQASCQKTIDSVLRSRHQGCRMSQENTSDNLSRSGDKLYPGTCTPQTEVLQGFRHLGRASCGVRVQFATMPLSMPLPISCFWRSLCSNNRFSCYCIVVSPWLSLRLTQREWNGTVGTVREAGLVVPAGVKYFRRKLSLHDLKHIFAIVSSELLFGPSPLPYHPCPTPPHLTLHPSLPPPPSHRTPTPRLTASLPPIHPLLSQYTHLPCVLAQGVRLISYVCPNLSPRLTRNVPRVPAWPD